MDARKVGEALGKLGRDFNKLDGELYVHDDVITPLTEALNHATLAYSDQVYDHVSHISKSIMAEVRRSNAEVGQVVADAHKQMMALKEALPGKLEESEPSEEPCPYCTRVNEVNEVKCLIKRHQEEPYEGDLYINGNCLEFAGDTAQTCCINYCPICGRKLGGNNR